MAKTIVRIITGEAVTEAVRSAVGRGDMDRARAIFSGGVSDDIIRRIGEGDLEVRGDSRTEMEIFTIDRTYLWPTPYEGERDEDDRIDVTGRREREIERIERGVLMQMDRDRFWLDRVTVPGEPLPDEGAP